MTSPGNFSFPRLSRLSKGSDFTRLKESGARIVSGCLILNWKVRPDADTPRLGVITSKKVGGAVARNRARRQVREWFRHWRGSLVPADLVVVARQSIAHSASHRIGRDFKTALQRANLCRENAPPLAVDDKTRHQPRNLVNEGEPRHNP